MSAPPGSVLKKEGDTELHVPSIHSEKGPGKRIGRVFFNDQMAFNRDVTVMLLAAYPRALTALDAMASTGARAMRIAREARPDMKIVANDKDAEACEYISANIEHTGSDNVEVSNDDLRCILARRVFDYIDLDPFGTPVPFVPAVMQGLKRHGVAGITATDTAPLAGTYPRKCLRRYGAHSMRSPFGHESGLRILIGHIAREAAKEDKGLECLLSFYADHYMRTYVRVVDGGGEADRTIEKLGYVDYDPSTGERSISRERTSSRSIGPLWLGPLHDAEVLGEMEARESLQTRRRCAKYLEVWRQELDVPFFYDNDELASLVRTSPRRLDAVLEALGASGRVSRTHFAPTGIRTDLPLRDVLYIYASVKEQ
ncbi:MAG: tRNA (guanine(26)-N(2))-dimethyltransferase [Methanomassiliicoccus sp.]|nr:tRNA (guanine(26)-N(2))-dimethyltransferase [Methanomassiliicoccus sp.]